MVRVYTAGVCLPMPLSDRLPLKAGLLEGSVTRTAAVAVVLVCALGTIGLRKRGASWPHPLGLWGGGSLAAAGSVPPAVHTFILKEWAATPESFSFTAPQSQCTLHPNSELLPMAAGVVYAALRRLLAATARAPTAATSGCCSPDTTPAACRHG